MRALITGVAGFIGSNLARHWLSQGHSIVGLDDLSAGSVHALRDCFSAGNFWFAKGSVLDLDTVRRVTARCDVVVHLAAQVHVEESIIDPSLSYQTNALGTQVVLEASRELGTPLVVYASSTEAYGKQEQDPIREDAPFCPQSPYAAGKAAADGLCAAYHATFGTPVVRLRQFNTYGPGQRMRGYAAVIPIFASRLWGGRPPLIYGTGEQSRDFHFISDLLRAYDLVVNAGRRIAGMALNVGTGTATTIADIATLMSVAAADEWDRRELSELAALHGAPRPGEVPQITADASLANDVLGFRPAICLEDGIREYLRWFRAEMA